MVNKPTILITEKSNSHSCITNDSLFDYRIIRNSDPREVFSLVSLNRPDLIILDANMEGISGYELLKTLKSFYKTKNIPVVLVADVMEESDPCRALELGAIDFVLKPISEHLMMAKINNFVQLHQSFVELETRASYAREMNPNTGLPGNTAIKRYVMNSLSQKKEQVIIYADLDNFKSYNDRYGFGKGDQIIQLTAEVIQKSLDTLQSESFMGHIGGDDFVLVVDKSEVKKVTSAIIKEFDKQVKLFYSDEDRKRGYIVSKDRQEQVQKFPIMTISMAGVDLTDHEEPTRYEYIADLCAEVKKMAKTQNKSCYYEDRRHHEHNKFLELLYSSVG